MTPEEQTQVQKKICPHCGNTHIWPGTPEEEYRQADNCRNQEWMDIQAEREAWYENHWDTI